ncbi:MAG TPA: PrsW family glutamic-type intramembrane protease [Candidatus Saccharimonadia bacterium]|nr:PrsW family glutamic-type intramembrane protease [Candidatus Saccharimonadia bacterium]
MSQWRSRAFHLTRDRTFLLRVAGIIVGVCIFIAGTSLLIRGKETPIPVLGTLTPEQAAQTGRSIIKEEYQLLKKSPVQDPGRVMKWLMDLEKEEGESFDPVTLKFEDMDLEGLFRQHAQDERLQRALAAYARFRFQEDEAAKQKALGELAAISTTEGAPRHANELYAEILLRLRRPADVLDAWMRESRFPDATAARHNAFEVALEMKNSSALRELCSHEDLRRDMDAYALRDAAIIIPDKKLLVHAMARLTWERWMQGGALFIVLLAPGIWYGILVYTGSSERYRWLRYLPAVFAGIISVVALTWAQETLDYRMPSDGDAPTPTHAMMDWVLNVGLPEEFVKLLLFSFFLPVLLHSGSAVKAALTGGCVGLGFALDENLLYFSMEGSAIALGRFLTANFLHIALTGILGWGLYQLFRSRFHKATEFLTVFVGVTLAHGLYDFTATIANEGWGLEIMHIVILAASAKFYLKLLHSASDKPAGWVISRTAIFLWGIALLVGIMVIVNTWQMNSIQGITETLSAALSLAVVSFIFVREFQEV